MEHALCSQLTKAGAPCRGKVAEADRCLAHVEGGRPKGGRPRKAPPAPLDLTSHDKIRRFIEETAQAVATGKMPARTGQVLASLARAAQASVDNDQAELLSRYAEHLATCNQSTVIQRRR